jgi:hypothetical protein
MVTGSIAGCLQSRWLMPLSSTMTRLNYLMEAPSDCGPEDANFLAFVEVTYIIGGCDAKKVEVKESPLSKVVVPMPQVTIVIGALLRCRLQMSRICWWPTIILRNTMPIEGFGMGDSITFLSWPGCCASPNPNLLGGSASLLLWHRL